MAKIVQVLTRPSKQYDLFTAEAQVRQSWKLGTFRLDIQPDGRR